MVKEHFGLNLILFLFTYNQGFFTKGEKGGRGRFFNNSETKKKRIQGTVL